MVPDLVLMDQRSASCDGLLTHSGLWRPLCALPRALNKTVHVLLRQSFYWTSKLAFFYDDWCSALSIQFCECQDWFILALTWLEVPLIYALHSHTFLFDSTPRWRECTPTDYAMSIPESYTCFQWNKTFTGPICYSLGKWNRTHSGIASTNQYNDMLEN